MCVRSSTAFYSGFNLDMGRSPGFGPASADSFALLRLGFPSAPDFMSLTLPAAAARRTVLQKVRGCTKGICPLAPTACRHRVSGSLSLPSRGSFHLSFTVLLLYRSLGSILAWRVVPPPSLRIPRVRRYSGYRAPLRRFVYMTLTFFGWASHPIPLRLNFALRSLPRGYFYPRFGLFRFRSPLLTESRLITFPPPT